MRKVRFFKPFVGANYHKGINGKKVLVVGASFYCNKLDCEFFSECTNVTLKDSGPFDSMCPYTKEGLLSEEPTRNIIDGYEECYKAYTNFDRAVRNLTGTNSYEETWSYMAFTNYVQFFPPATEGKNRPTYASDLSERDFDAFNETLLELEPDIVVIWGKVINSVLMCNNKYLVDKEELVRTGNYICQIKLPDIGKNIKLINSYHPTARYYWHNNIQIFINHFKSLL